MRRPPVIPRQPDLFASKDPPATLKITERSMLLALVSLLLTETMTIAGDEAMEGDHEDHL